MIGRSVSRVVRSGQLAPESPALLWSELENEDRFGAAIAPIGDLDGDGQLEIAVSARFDDDGADAAGAVYVLHTALPEPSAFLGLATGIALLAAIGRKRMHL